MNDLLSKDEDATALQQGWGVHHVYDLATCSWSVRILPAAIVPTIIQRAKALDPLPLKALRLMAHNKGQT